MLESAGPIDNSMAALTRNKERYTVFARVTALWRLQVSGCAAAAYKDSVLMLRCAALEPKKPRPPGFFGINAAQRNIKSFKAGAEEANFWFRESQKVLHNSLQQID